MAGPALYLPGPGPWITPSPQIGRTGAAVTARAFDGVDDKITVPAIDLVGPYSIAALVRRNHAAVADTIIAHIDSGATLQSQFRFNASDQLNLITIAGTARTSTTTVLDTDGWVVVAVTKASGAATPRFHIYKGGAWTHEDAAGTTVDPATTVGGSTVLGSNNAATFSLMDFSVVGEWIGTALTDGNIESLVTNRKTADWEALAPQALWEFSQTDVASPLLDISGGGYSQTAITGTTVITTGPVPWTYYGLLSLSADTGTATAGGGTVNFTAGQLNLSATNGAATTAGSATLAFTYTAASGTATTGGTVSLAEALTAASGTATATGSYVLTFVYLAASGAATAGGGTVNFSAGTTLSLSADTGTATAAGGTASLAFTYTAATGTATTSGTATLAFTFTASTGTATAGGGTLVWRPTWLAASGAASTSGTVALAFVYLASTGTATAGGGAASFTRAITAASGLATAGGGTLSLAFTYLASTGTATTNGVVDISTGAGFSGTVTGGAATATGTSPTLAFGYGAATGTATAVGGTVTVSIVGAPTGGGLEMPVLLLTILDDDD